MSTNDQCTWEEQGIGKKKRYETQEYAHNTNMAVSIASSFPGNRREEIFWGECKLKDHAM